MYTAKIYLNSVPGSPIKLIVQGLTSGQPCNEWGKNQLQWQHRLPSNGATKSAFYDLIYQNRKVINFKIGTYLHHGVLVTRPNLGINRSKVKVTQTHYVCS